MKLNNTKYKLEMKKLFLLLAVVVVAVNAVSQNIENGHAYVDLGLPSGLKWADANVGASKTEDFGTHYAWGDAQAKKSYNWSVYKWGKVKNPNLAKMVLLITSCNLTLAKTLQISVGAGNGVCQPQLISRNSLVTLQQNGWKTIMVQM